MRFPGRTLVIAAAPMTLAIVGLFVGRGLGSAAARSDRAELEIQQTRRDLAKVQEQMDLLIPEANTASGELDGVEAQYDRVRNQLKSGKSRISRLQRRVTRLEGILGVGGGCDPSYPGVCIPIGADDYDCLVGGGNGPNFIGGPLQVLPPDPHGLDGYDNDGVGCESG